MGTCVYDGRAVIKSSLTSYIVSGELLPSPLWVSTAWFESRSRIQAISRPDHVYFIHKPDCRSYVRPERLSAPGRLTFMVQFVRQSSLLTFRTLCFFLTPGTVNANLFALFNRYSGAENFRFRINVPAKWNVLGNPYYCCDTTVVARCVLQLGHLVYRNFNFMRWETAMRNWHD